MPEPDERLYAPCDIPATHADLDTLYETLQREIVMWQIVNCLLAAALLWSVCSH